MDINFIVDEYEREVGMEFNTFFILKRTRTLVNRCKDMPISKEEEADGKVHSGVWLSNMVTICISNHSPYLKHNVLKR